MICATPFSRASGRLQRLAEAGLTLANLMGFPTKAVARTSIADIRDLKDLDELSAAYLYDPAGQLRWIDIRVWIGHRLPVNLHATLRDQAPSLAIGGRQCE